MNGFISFLADREASKHVPPQKKCYIWGGHFRKAHMEASLAKGTRRSFTIPWDGSNPRLRHGEEMILCPVVLLVK